MTAYVALRGDELGPSMIGAQLATTVRADDPSEPVERISDKRLAKYRRARCPVALDV